MSESKKASVPEVKVAQPAAFANERQTFKLLLLSNPNYFGNLATSPFKPVLSMVANTYYEELAAVGYQPQQQRLEGVVHLRRSTGYGSDLCGTGTPEYVRFFLSFDQGATWEDQGMTSFQAHDIPVSDGGQRLEFAVSLPVDLSAKRRFCWLDPLIRMRAILSWNDPPPEGNPDWPPVWGNVREATIQMEPAPAIFWKDITAELKLSPYLTAAIDLDLPLQMKNKSLGVGELAELYLDKGVPVHRFAAKELVAFASGKVALNATSLASLLPDIQIVGSLGSILFPKTDGDTSYEELKFVGLDPNRPDTVVGVIQVKKPVGYSGAPCTAGSKEYVTFWADFDGNGSFETCLGTAAVGVHDLAQIPSEGVYYSVRLSVDLTPYRQSCKNPRNVKIRAILSWNTPAPCADPNHVPTWGNREEVLVNIAPGVAAQGGKIAILGGIPVSWISKGGQPGELLGHTTHDAKFATNNLPPDSLGRPCPFAGLVTVQGAPPNVQGTLIPGHSYKVEVFESGGAPIPVVTDLWVTDQNGVAHLQKADATTGRFPYLDFNQNINSLLAQWYTWGSGLWTVRLTEFDASNSQVGTDEHVVKLDNTGPQVSIRITSGAGSCGKFTVGEKLEGKFVAIDDYPGIYRLDILPADLNPAGVAVPDPNSGTENTAPAPGNPWSLKTEGMKPCGYVIRVRAWDRAIINSQAVGHYDEASAGFCLDAPKK